MRHRFLPPIFAALFLVASAAAQPAASGPRLAELFTSQGCSSCPPAEDLFASLAEDEGLVTIEWHVDYWDRLVHGGASWKDPYSSPDNTARQRAYNKALRGTTGVYTPQAILDGSAEFIGSRPAELAAARRKMPDQSAQIIATSGIVTITGKGRGEVVFVRLQASQLTDVKAGENKGRKLASRNIARERIKLGDWSGGPAKFDIPKLNQGESCALFVQSESETGGPGPVLGASYCAQ